MKIASSKCKRTFKELDLGDVFRNGYDYFMRISRVDGNNCVNLETGALRHAEDDTPITKVDGEFVVKYD